jgi:hypothetical protein
VGFQGTNIIRHASWNLCVTEVATAVAVEAVDGAEKSEKAVCRPGHP